MTPRQIEALEGAFETGNAWSRLRGRSSNCGGAVNRMIEGLYSDKLLNRKTGKITAAGMRSLANHYSCRTNAGPMRSRPIFVEKLAKVQEALPAVQAAEDEVRAAETAEQTRLADLQRDRIAAAKVERVRLGRGVFAAVGLDVTAMSDDAVDALIERIARL